MIGLAAIYVSRGGCLCVQDKYAESIVSFLNSLFGIYLNTGTHYALYYHIVSDPIHKQLREPQQSMGSSRPDNKLLRCFSLQLIEVPTRLDDFQYMLATHLPGVLAFWQMVQAILKSPSNFSCSYRGFPRKELPVHRIAVC